MGLLCYPFSLDWETFSGAKVNKKVFYAKKMWEYLFFFDMRYEKNRNMPTVYELLYNKVRQLSDDFGICSGDVYSRPVAAFTPILLGKGLEACAPQEG